jgi:hypothetical protein
MAMLGFGPAAVGIGPATRFGSASGPHSLFARNPMIFWH